MAWLVLLLERRCLLNGYVCSRAKGGVFLLPFSRRQPLFPLSRYGKAATESVEPIGGRVFPCRMLAPWMGREHLSGYGLGRCWMSNLGCSNSASRRRPICSLSFHRNQARGL